MKEIQQAGGIIINAKGEIAIITNNIGRQTFPKGKQEFGETLVETAKREIREETGLKEFELHHEIGVLTRPGFTDGNHEWPSVIKHIHLFYCTTDQNDLKPEAPDVIEANWVKPEDISRVLSWPEEVAFFEKYRDKLEL